MRYVAFLRAINVANRRIKMADLRSVYTETGLSNVETYIASGNVVFDAANPPSAPHLQEIFEERFGFTSEIFLRTSDELRTVVESVPWEPGFQVVEVSFLGRVPQRDDALALERSAVAPEALAVSGREVFFRRGGKGAPTTHKESTSIELLGMNMTRRGLATVQKIANRFLQ
jgi:uncharacterized protein (DUF1697 family)